MPAYRLSSQHSWKWLAICGLGIASQLLTLFLLRKTGLEDRLQMWALAVSIIPFLAWFVIGLWMLERLKKKRLSSLSRELGALGFERSMRPASEEKQSFCQPLEALMQRMRMNRGPDAVQWLALNRQGEAPVAAWEYLYVIGSGKTANTHQFTALAWPAGHPSTPAELAALPPCELRFELWLERKYRRKSEIPVAGLPEAWAAYGDGCTAARFLEAGAAAALAEGAKTEGWMIGAGWVACVVRGGLDGANFRLFYEHASRVLESLPRQAGGKRA